jgi:peroxiredoxin
MSNILKRLIVLPVLLTAALVACAQANPGILGIDQTVPDFKLNSAAGDSVSLSSQAGKYVVINFWQTTCPPCRAEMPHFQALYPSWQARGIVFLAVDIGEKSSAVSDFASGLGLTFPLLLDSQGEVAGKYGIQYTPTTLFVDPEGRLKSKVVGAFKDPNSIESHLKSLQN